jgi:hypothetical protein
MEAMNTKELKARLEAHKLWLTNTAKGDRLVLINSDLSYSNLCGSNLRGSNLSGSDLRGSDLSGSNLRGSNLRGSDLSGSDLRGSDLSGSDLSYSKGLLDAGAYLAAEFETSADGFIVYKFESSVPTYPPNPAWTFETGAVLEEVVNPLPTLDCACGVNVATKAWCKRAYDGHTGKLWKCLIRWAWAPSIVVPYNTDGKIRCSKVELLEVVE